MSRLSRITDLELVGPTAIGFRLVDEHREHSTGQIVVSPANFITDFSVFLTAVRAGGETRPVDAASLANSWQETRELLRRWLVEQDPWGEPASPAANEEALAALGEERLTVYRGKQGAVQPHATDDRPASVRNPTSSEGR